MRKTIPYIIAGIIFLAFVTVNIYASQRFHPLFYKIVLDPDVPAAGQFLSEIRTSPYYQDQRDYFNGEFNDIFQRQLLQERFNQDSQLKKYEEILKMNPKSRDILLGIAFIHYQKGDKERAREFYRRAQEIDPWLKVDLLAR